jgi:hypothetical protein
MAVGDKQTRAAPVVANYLRSNFFEGSNLYELPLEALPD